MSRRPTAKKPAKKTPAKVKAEPVKKKTPAKVKAEPVKKKTPAKVKAEPVKKKAPAKVKAKPAKKKAPVKAKAPAKPTRKPTKKEIDKAKETIKARLDKTAEEVGGKVRVHVYPDGSIDGEISIDVVKGQSASDLFLDVEGAFKKQSLGKGYWISTGERHVIQEDAEVYRRHKGMNEVAVYYQRATPSNIAETMLIARRNITPAMERKYKRKASTIFVRLHWNAGDVKPKRFR